MKTKFAIGLVCVALIGAAVTASTVLTSVSGFPGDQQQSMVVPVSHEQNSRRISSTENVESVSRIGTVIEDSGGVQLVQLNQCQSCGVETGGAASCNCNPGPSFQFGNRTAECNKVGPLQQQAPGLTKGVLGVNENVGRRIGREPGFRDSQIVPWEMFAYGEYVGPHRTPHVPDYRLRVNDELEFVYFRNRKQSVNAYQLFVGDVLRISSATDETINQPEVVILSDGSISLPLISQVRAAGKTISDLQDELNDLYLEYLNDPAVLVQIVEGDTPLRDVIASVDATAGAGGQLRQAVVSPDGTVQLPVVGSVPAIGLTLDEIRREVNFRYRELVPGLEVTPVLTQRAPTFVYVIGQVTTPGRFELEGPTTALQAIALAEGDLQGGNLRNIVVFRRDENWRLTATRLDLAGAIHGKSPLPSDEIFLRDSDIVLVPRKPIQRLSEAVDLYLTNTLYSIFPQEIIFDFNSTFGN